MVCRDTGGNKETEGRKGPWLRWYNSRNAEIWRGNSCGLEELNMQPRMGAIKVPQDWVMAIIVLLYKGKGNREESNNYRGISLLSVPGKIYGRILNERMMKITDMSVGGEQEGFQKGRGCVD